MAESMDFFEYKHSKLILNYVREDGAPESCLEVAFSMADAIIAEGKKPLIRHLTGTEIDEINFEPLEPLPYYGEVVWLGHTICALEQEDGLVVYDPILEAPEPIESYPAKAFGADILVRESIYGKPTLYPAKP